MTFCILAFQKGVKMAADDMSRRMSFGSGSARSLGSAPGGDVFERSSRENDDEEELRWAAMERLPTYDRLRKGMLKQTLDNGKVVHQQVDVQNLGMQDKKLLMESIFKVVEQDNESP
nr:pleiotropic drug resistance protein 2-like [Ipomoea batatas]